VLLPTCATTHERPAIDLRRTGGYIVADRRGRFVGKVAFPMYRTAPDVPDALAVKAGLFPRDAGSSRRTRSSRSMARAA
jgi:hypothetical protein